MILWHNLNFFVHWLENNDLRLPFIKPDFTFGKTKQWGSWLNSMYAILLQTDVLEKRKSYL